MNDSRYRADSNTTPEPKPASKNCHPRCPAVSLLIGDGPGKVRRASACVSFSLPIHLVENIHNSLIVQLTKQFVDFASPFGDFVT